MTATGPGPAESPPPAGEGDRSAPRPSRGQGSSTGSPRADREGRPGGTSPGGPGWVWDERYASHEWPTDPDPSLVALAGDLTPGSAVDLGAGPGRNAIWLASRGWRVRCVDRSRVGLEQASARAAALGVTLETEEADLTDWESPTRRFDLAVLANIHLPAAPLASLVRRAAAALRSGGHLYLVGHHRDSHGRAGPPDPDLLFTETGIRQLLEGLPELDRVEVWRVERPGDEGSPLADVVAWAST